jgi:hypothetical protein
MSEIIRSFLGLGQRQGSLRETESTMILRTWGELPWSYEFDLEEVADMNVHGAYMVLKPRWSCKLLTMWKEGSHPIRLDSRCFT